MGGTAREALCCGWLVCPVPAVVVPCWQNKKWLSLLAEHMSGLPRARAHAASLWHVAS